MEPTYKAHHEKAQNIYANANGTPKNNLTLDDLRVQIVKPNQANNVIELPDNYMKIVNSLAKQASERFEKKECCFFPPKVNPKNDVTLRLRDEENYHITGIEELAQHILPQLEAKYYHSYLHLEKCYFYRSFPTNNKPRTSWLWHYDNHPTEIHKVIVYLTDVTEDSGPFEYIRNKEKVAKVIAPSRQGLKHWKGPKWKSSRVPLDVIDDYLKSGYEAHRAVGGKGTMLIFDNNCVHRANVARKGHRDVMALQIRPAKMKMRPYLSRNWTGGFEANDIVKDPDIIKPSKKFAK